MFKNMVSPERLTAVFRKQYELCAVKPGETIAFLTDQNSDRGIVAAGLAAAAEIGNPAFEVRVNEGPNEEYMGANPLNAPALIEAFKRVDLVITFFAGFFSGWEGAVSQWEPPPEFSGGGCRASPRLAISPAWRICWTGPKRAESRS